jgi:hypothetical protein
MMKMNLKDSFDWLCIALFCIGAVWAIIGYIYLAFTSMDFWLYAGSGYGFYLLLKLAWPGFLMMLFGGFGLYLTEGDNHE